MFFEIGVFKNSQISLGNTCVGDFFKKLQSQFWNFISKKALTQVFSCEIFWNFQEHLQWLFLNNGLQRKDEILPLYMTKVTGLERKKLIK